MYLNQVTTANAIADRAVAGTATDTASGEAFSLPLSENEEQPKISEREAVRAKTEELLKKLNDYIDKGPVVALREQILKSMGLTEADLKNLPPEEQMAIEQTIEQKIKEFLLKRKEQEKPPRLPLQPCRRRECRPPSSRRRRFRCTRCSTSSEFAPRRIMTAWAVYCTDGQ